MNSGYGQHFKKLKSKPKAPVPRVRNPKVRASKGRKSQRTSMAWALISLLGFLVCLVLVLWEKQVEDYFSRISVRVLGGGAIAQEKTAETKGPSKEKNDQTPTEDDEQLFEDMKSWGPNELSFLKDLTRRKNQLDERKRDLVQLEEELQRRKVEVEERIAELDKTRQKISEMLTDRVAEDGARVDKLVETYSGMKPQNAAQIIGGLNESLAISVLTRMNKRNASEVMNFMDPKKAQELSEKFAGYKK